MNQWTMMMIEHRKRVLVVAVLFGAILASLVGLAFVSGEAMADTIWLATSYKDATPQKVSPGGTVSYSIVLINSDSGNATTSVVVTDPLDPELSYVGGSAEIVGGEGVWLLGPDGRRILDGAGGAIVSNIGHGRSEVADAVRGALDGGAYVVPIWPTPHRERLHDLLVDRWLPDGLGHVFFTSGGSESADSAIRLARAYHVARGQPERWKDDMCP